jgi:two-component system sensor histidine kinase KdpD
MANELPAVQIDALQIEQVLTNLIENAAKYSPSGTPIHVDARQVERDGKQWLRLTVRDHGPGIDPSERVRIFDKFYRITGTSARTSGTGMGLAIVKGLVDAHGGMVHVEDAAGGGSAFIVDLPVRRVFAQ